jgi:hypothetical protein
VKQAHEASAAAATAHATAQASAASAADSQQPRYRPLQCCTSFAGTQPFAAVLAIASAESVCRCVGCFAVSTFYDQHCCRPVTHALRVQHAHTATTPVTAAATAPMTVTCHSWWRWWWRARMRRRHKRRSCACTQRPQTSRQAKCPTPVGTVPHDDHCAGHRACAMQPGLYARPAHVHTCIV